MRSEDELIEKYLYCREQRSYWSRIMWKAKESEGAKINHRMWHERVKTLEFVLGITDRLDTV
ncbi:hypothetical protein NXG04_07855 [Klebsiella pneumoniae]|nr:hypothetical protein [Klebsiella pneumoniae]MDS7714469.1 hypothetical protein [Klebsiella pneumoniae]UUV46354.1 hypothetical protein [Bacillus phage vB_BanS-Thrax2]